MVTLGIASLFLPPSTDKVTAMEKCYFPLLFGLFDYWAACMNDICTLNVIWLQYSRNTADSDSLFIIISHNEHTHMLIVSGQCNENVSEVQHIYQQGHPERWLASVTAFLESRDNCNTQECSKGHVVDKTVQLQVAVSKKGFPQNSHNSTRCSNVLLLKFWTRTTFTPTTFSCLRNYMKTTSVKWCTANGCQINCLLRVNFSH